MGKVAPGRMGEADRASLQESIAEYKKERSMYQQLLAESQVPAGKPAEATPQSNAKPKPVAALPKGAKQVGTSGGRPVYETPDGKRFIGN